MQAKGKKAVSREDREVLYKNIIGSVMSSLKKYSVQDLRWALNRWAKTENAKARLRREIAERQRELGSLK